MPVNRILSQINLKKADSVLLLYGQVNDAFVTADLSLYDTDGIEKVLCRFLRDNGYQQVIFYAPERQLYTYDEQSYYFCFPDENGESKSGALPGERNPSDGRPLGLKSFLKRPAVNAPKTSAKPRWNTREGFISVVQGGGDAAVMDIIRESLFQNRRKSVVIFSQFDNPGTGSEIQRLLLPLIPRLLRRANENKCIMIGNALDQEKLSEVVQSIPVLNTVIKMNGVGKGLDSLIYIGYPQKDEIRNLIHRERILKGKPLDWLQLERMVVALDQGRDELKRWQKEFQALPQFNIPSLNSILNETIDEQEKSALRKLEGLIGLTEAKNQLQRHLLQIRDMRENNPHEKPLMHMVLKGNPGTGKTSLARIIAEMLREEGLLDRGHLVEVDREKLVAGYIGQTAMKTDSCCRNALGGVLFVDEAYALAPKTNNESQDFGRESIDTLIKRMTDWQDCFCVILAGYPEEMDHLLEANPGFKGRIGLTLSIEDYLPAELTAIFAQKTEKAKRSMSNAFKAGILNVLTELYKKRGKKFDNARMVEQLFAKITGLYLHRCQQQGLDVKEEPYQSEDIPKELQAYREAPSATGSAMDRLTGMTGLEKAKRQIKKQIALVQAERNHPGYTKGRRLHMVFKGNPGTGKTSVARLVGEIYQHFEVLSNNNFVEASRQDLVGAYAGQTAMKVEAKCREAMGGVLFIDEAYTLVNGETDQLGKEAVETLLKIMDDQRANLCVVVAGYPDKMDDFLNSNPGLSRRFPTIVEFEDYNSDQLLAIFEKAVLKKKINLASGMSQVAAQVLQALYDRRNEHFGNAGEVENLLQQIQEEHAIRCLDIGLPVDSTPIELGDIPETLLRLLPASNSDELIAEALQELNELTGLAAVKSHITELVEEYKHERFMRLRKPGQITDKRNHHLIFKGNPGTGKTTVARIVGKIFKALDILKSGELIEVSRADLVAGYQGQTAQKTKKQIHKAFDNVLFIDEAYSLANDVFDGFGQEALVVLLKMMEDHRDRLVVIAAGYPREIKQFLRSNSGLSSRFTHEIYFADFDTVEMVAIFKSTVLRRGYLCGDNLDDALEEELSRYKAGKGSDFGNARDVIGFLDKVVMPKYRRRVQLLDPADESFWKITLADLPEGERKGAHSKPGDIIAFSPEQERIDQRNNAAAIIHNGAGDIVKGNKITNNYTTVERVLPARLTMMPDWKGANIWGREEQVKEMFNLLFDRKHPDKILLYGLPGIGKTQTIIKFLDTHGETFGHIIWLDANSNLRKTFIENKLLLENLGVDFTENQDEEQRFANVLSALNKIEGNNLLIIDGLPAIAEAAFRGLSLHNFKVVASARERIIGVQAIVLESLAPQAANSLFLSFCDDTMAPERLDDLLEAISYHPLAIEILAKILATNPGMSFNSLLDQVHKGLDIRSGKIDISYDLGPEAGNKVIHIFSTLFRLADLNPEQLTFLRYFSVLPAYPLAQELLHELFELHTDDQRVDFNGIVASLQQKGFLSIEQGRGIFCHQIIQQVCRADSLPSETNCAILLNSLGERLNWKIDEAMLRGGIYPFVCDYLRVLEVFAAHFDGESLTRHDIYLNLTLLYRVNGQFERAIAVARAEIAIRIPQMETDPVRYSEINRNLAYASAYNGDYHDAELCFNEGTHFLEHLELDGHAQREIIEQELILNYSQLGILQLRAEVYDVRGATVYFEKGLELSSRSTGDVQFGLAVLKEGLALAQIEQGEYREAITNLESVKELLIKDLELERTALPVAQLNLWLALAHAAGGNFGEGRRLAARGLDAIKKHLPEDNIEQFRAYHVLALVGLMDGLTRMDNGEKPDEDLFQQAADAMEKAIKIFKISRKDSGEELAMMYSNCGLLMKYAGHEQVGYELHQQGVAIYRQIDHQNELAAGIIFRTVIFFEGQLSPAQAVADLGLCHRILSVSADSQIDLAYINYYLGIFKQKDGRSRDAIVAIGTALSQVRAYFNKDGDPDNDSPLEVIFLQEMALVQSAVGEHRNAISTQQEALDLCMAHMNPRDEEMAGIYAVMAKIYLAAADKLGEMEFYARSLHYKTQAVTLNEKIVRSHKELDGSAELYEVEQHYMIIPIEYFSRLEADFRKGHLDRLESYGFVLPAVKDTASRTHTLKAYTDQYGPLNTQFVNLN